ncbi:MAG: acyltransferase [Spirochaetaceae bacterium]|jgi:acetyltransferase-like isoleucine patch superfamily enzyme|nr:acyltransferase [Spirochaetaceae bacterium]
MIAETAKIYENVSLGKNVTIEDFCIIGKPPSGKNNGQLPTVIGDNSLIRSHSVIYAGNTIGEAFSTGHHVTIREKNEIASNVSIGTGSCIEHHIKINRDVRIHSQVFIPEYTKLEEKAWIGPNVVITNAKYPRGKNVKSLLKGATLGKACKIGANSTLLPGVYIGEKSLIGAGSLVSKDIPSGVLAFGTPAKVIKSIDNIDEYTVELTSRGEKR